MQPIFCAVLLAMILHPAECRRYSQDYESEDEGDYGRQGGGRYGIRKQKPMQGGLEQLTGLAQKFLGGQQDGGSGHGKKCPLAGLAQKFGSSGGQQCPLAKLGGVLGSVLGGGGGGGGGNGLGPLLGGLGGLFSGKGKGSGSGKCGGRQKKFGSFNHGAESGRRGHGSDYDDEEEESDRGGRYGSRYGRKQDRYSGYGRETEDDDEDY